MPINSVGNTSPSTVLRLRYLEWLFLATHLVLSVSDGEFNLAPHLIIYSIFIAFSLIFPINIPLRLRIGYILSAMLLIIFANFSDVSLDMLLYLYIAKSFFLLGAKSSIWITIAIGIGWVACEYYSEIQELKQSSSIRFEPPFGAGDYSSQSILIFSLGLYVAVSIFTIFFSSVIVSEYKSRKKAETLAEEVEILAKNLERARIARDIHDSLGHTLTNLDIQLKVAQKLRDRNLEEAFQAIDLATILSAQCIEDLSHAVKTIRHHNFDLDLALNNLIEQVRNDLALHIEWSVNLPQLSLPTSYQIYYVIREGLTNIQKHANASQVRFQGYFTSTEIFFELEDNGIGFDREQVSSGFGLQGMVERMQAVRGKLEINSVAGRGTQVLLTIPR